MKKATHETETLLTVPQAATALCLSDVRVRQLCQEGRLGRKVGSLYIIGESEIKAFAKQKRPPGRKPAKI